ncbi:MAG TPA: hypothetical protein VFW96_27125 [Thermomicrobiales bacterium]|nr:hypothetical protein [Thermomicrobiales bacterium]
MTALSNSVHIYARPESTEGLVRCFTAILGAEVVASADAPGLPTPVLAFRFPGGGALSVEFTADALDERQARRGAWLEIQADDAAAVQRRIREAGLPQLRHPANDHFYFAAPGGQVLRIVQTRYTAARVPG